MVYRQARSTKAINEKRGYSASTNRRLRRIQRQCLSGAPLGDDRPAAPGANLDHIDLAAPARERPRGGRRRREQRQLAGGHARNIARRHELSTLGGLRRRRQPALARLGNQREMLMMLTAVVAILRLAAEHLELDAIDERALAA